MKGVALFQNDRIHISGFADEIAVDFEEQLKTVTELGMHYISLRSANGKGIADYTVDEVRDQLVPLMDRHGVKVSSIGSPIGKVGIADEEGFEKQLDQLETLCQVCELLGCRFIRIFSFYMPEGEDPDGYRGEVLRKLREYVRVAGSHDVVLIHENEKEIYGDTGDRCRVILEELASPHFRAAFDFANFVQCDENPAACWDLLQPYISYIHIKDAVCGTNENVVCGTGDGKIAQLLKRAIVDEGYEGFLTLEPHLIAFDSLKTLEKRDVAEVIKGSSFANGADGYAAQYRALMDILNGLA